MFTPAPLQSAWSRNEQRRLHRIWTCILAFGCSMACVAQSSSALSPSDVEAAYLYNFGKFVEWPQQSPSPTASFTICIAGKDEFGRTLDALIENDTLKGQSISVKRLTFINATDNCQILFLGLSEQARLTRDMEVLKDKPILMVSSIPGFLDHGGMIQFLVQDNRVRFAVNLAATARAHLSLSSELLKVAVYVAAKPSREGE